MCSSQLDSPLNERRGPPRKEAELEVRLILGSSFRGWTIAENFMRARPFEFRYAKESAW
jgi:hypothetical protein